MRQMCVALGDAIGDVVILKSDEQDDGNLIAAASPKCVYDSIAGFSFLCGTTNNHSDSVDGLGFQTQAVHVRVDALAEDRRCVALGLSELTCVPIMNIEWQTIIP